jgi:hypothetical protein
MHGIYLQSTVAAKLKPHVASKATQVSTRQTTTPAVNPLIIHVDQLEDSDEEGQEEDIQNAVAPFVDNMKQMVVQKTDFRSSEILRLKQLIAQKEAKLKQKSDDRAASPVDRQSSTPSPPSMDLSEHSAVSPPTSSATPQTSAAAQEKDIEKSLATEKLPVNNKDAKDSVESSAKRDRLAHSKESESVEETRTTEKQLTVVNTTIAKPPISSALLGRRVVDESTLEVMYEGIKHQERVVSGYVTDLHDIENKSLQTEQDLLYNRNNQENLEIRIRILQEQLRVMQAKLGEAKKDEQMLSLRKRSLEEEQKSKRDIIASKKFSLEKDRTRFSEIEIEWQLAQQISGDSSELPTWRVSDKDPMKQLTDRKEAEILLLEMEKKESERKEEERRAEKKEAERREAEKREAERAKRDAERKEADRKEVERREAQRKEAARREEEKRQKEVEKREAARKEQEKRAAEKKEREKKERERKEAARKEEEKAKRYAEKKEAERREAEKLEAERERAKREAEKQAEKERQEQEAEKRAKELSKMKQMIEQKSKPVGPSPLFQFRSFRLNPLYKTKYHLKYASQTFSNKIDPDHIMCRFELHGVCNDDECKWQHKRNYTLTDKELLADLASYADDTQKENVNQFLASLLKSGDLSIEDAASRLVLKMGNWSQSHPHYIVASHVPRYKQLKRTASEALKRSSNHSKREHVDKAAKTDKDKAQENNEDIWLPSYIPLYDSVSEEETQRDHISSDSRYWRLIPTEEPSDFVAMLNKNPLDVRLWLDYALSVRISNFYI